MEVDEAFSLISRAIDSGHAAHGYLVVGDLKGQCDLLVERVLRKLFPEASDQAVNRSHPDVAWLEPEGRSRTIAVGSMRERIVEPMLTTAFSGGWKVGIVVSADRLQPAAANAFLKTLEEPSSRTLFLLLTDAPDGILPTVVSRTQRVDLRLSAGVLEGDVFEAVSDAFAAKDGAALAEIFAELKDEAEDKDVAFVRKRFFKTLMVFVRAMMVSGRLPRHQAFHNIEAVEDACRQSERLMSDEAVLSFLMDRVVFPS